RVLVKIHARIDILVDGRKIQALDRRHRLGCCGATLGCRGRLRENGARTQQQNRCKENGFHCQDLSNRQFPEHAVWRGPRCRQAASLTAGRTVISALSSRLTCKATAYSPPSAGSSPHCKHNRFFTSRRSPCHTKAWTPRQSSSSTLGRSIPSSSLAGSASKTSFPLSFHAPCRSGKFRLTTPSALFSPAALLRSMTPTRRPPIPACSKPVLLFSASVMAFSSSCITLAARCAPPRSENMATPKSPWKTPPRRSLPASPRISPSG